jgi:hypothetical protein
MYLYQNKLINELRSGGQDELGNPLGGGAGRQLVPAAVVTLQLFLFLERFEGTHQVDGILTDSSVFQLSVSCDITTICTQQTLLVVLCVL